MKLAFYKGAGKMDGLIRWWTKSQFSHVEMVFDIATPATEHGPPAPPLCWSSSARDGGVRFKTIPLDDGKWILVDLPHVEPAIELAIRVWCSSLVGSPYGFLDVLRFVLPFLRSKRKQWFCSEAVLSALQSELFFLGHRPDNVSPGKLYKIVTAGIS
jgi:hypothetical protein